MRKIDFLDAVGRIDEEIIEEAIAADSITAYRAKKSLRLLPLCAAVALMVSLAVAIPLSHRSKPPIEPEVSETNDTVIIDDDGFYIENGVLVSYSGDDAEVVIPDAVYAIADNAFSVGGKAERITALTLGANVASIEPEAFAGLENMVELAVADGNVSFERRGDIVISTDGSLLLKYSPSEEKSSYDMPDTVKYIAAHAFQNCGLEQIKFSENLVYVGSYAFAGSSLTAIYLPDSTVELGDGAFSSCIHAVDGSVPEGIKLGDGAFWGVPFYLSLLAGKMSPAEEIERGLITPAEAIQKSDTSLIMDQINYFLACYNGLEYPSGVGEFGYSAFDWAAEAPEGIEIPESCDLDALGFVGEDFAANVQARLELELGYELIIEFYLYGREDYLHWEEVKWRAAKVYFAGGSDEKEGADFGWSADFETKDGKYSAVVFENTDGTVVRSYIGINSDIPFMLTYSPNGNRCAIEYEVGGVYCYYVQALDGESFELSQSGTVKYMNRYFGDYTGGTLYWIDNDHVGGVNEFGRFSHDLYKVYPEQLDGSDTDLNEKRTLFDYGYDFTVYMQIPADWRDRGCYTSPARENAGAEAIVLRLGELSQGFVLNENGNWYLDKLRERGLINDDSRITYGETASGFEYMLVTSYSGVEYEVREHSFFIKLNGSLSYYFTMYEYDDGFDSEDYYEQTVKAVLNSFGAYRYQAASYFFSDAYGVDFEELDTLERIGEGRLCIRYSSRFRRAFRRRRAIGTEIANLLMATGGFV